MVLYSLLILSTKNNVLKWLRIDFDSGRSGMFETFKSYLNKLKLSTKKGVKKA